jgi:putative colanic acid biosynthesis acetyltransferase WcaF
VPFHSWRSFLLRVFGASVGRGAHVYPSVKIWAPWNLDIGDQVGIGERVNLYCQAKIAIGNRAVISQQTFLCTGTHDYTSSGMKLICKPIIIGAYCWIAADVFVHPGITIGEGAVIGARSVVVKDMPEWMVCTGHPCVPIKQRIITDSSSK